VRSISHKIIPVPRLSDMHILNQVAKFELSEMDNTLENRNNLFKELLNETIKETCLEFLDGVDQSLLQSIKEEFIEKSFPVSQLMIWKNGKISYSTQLEQFKNLKKLVELKLDFLRSNQSDFQNLVNNFKIKTESVQQIEVQEDEIRSALTEIMLEGLCWVEPKILDKRETGYVSS